MTRVVGAAMLLGGVVLAGAAVSPRSGEGAVRAGPFEVGLSAAKQVFLSTDAIGVTASLTYVGPAPATTIHFLAFRAVTFEIDGDPSTVQPLRGRWGCEEQTLQRGVPFDVPMRNGADPSGRVTLRANVWDITATAELYRTSCHAGATVLSTAIKLEVRDDMAVPMIDLATSSAQGNACPLAAGGGVLVRDPTTGLGIGEEGTDRTLGVVWPYGFTARIQGGVALLIDRAGGVVAREGNRVRFGGGAGINHVFHACGDVWVPGPDEEP